MYTLDQLLQDNQTGHSTLQQDYFITVRSGGTKYGMYKQALRELYKRWRGLKDIYTAKQLAQVDIDELESKIACDYANIFDKKRDVINLNKKKVDMNETDKVISETEREFQRFYQQACALKTEIGELTEEKRNKLDIEMWQYKIKEMAALDYISTGRISKNVSELIMCIPSDMRQDILIEIKQPEKLIQWIENANQKFPEIENIDGLNINLLEE